MNTQQRKQLSVMPAEWAAHEATWISWPHEAKDFPGKLDAVQWLYVEIVRLIAASERVEILCADEQIREEAARRLQVSHVQGNFRLHVKACDRSWLRDSAPSFVFDTRGILQALAWQFNGWAKYANHLRDLEIPSFVSQQVDRPLIQPLWEDGSRVVLEGGAIEVNGSGSILVTEECLLSSVQARNAGRTRQEYEQVFKTYLGAENTVWLPAGIAGDDTHGHIDDIARFVSEDTVVLAYEEDERDENHLITSACLSVLQKQHFQIVKLPMPRTILFDGYRLPASYANFYITNGAVLVPVFNDRQDARALSILKELFPKREVIGIYAGDLVLGLGTLHCLTQQQPKENN